MLVDIDGVISLFGFDSDTRPPGRFLNVDGIAHYISATAGGHLVALAERYELVWCSGWEDKANDYLPRALGLPEALPYLTFDRGADAGGHWKLTAIERCAGGRPLAWIDDDHGACAEWARARRAPTLLVATDPAVGIEPRHVEDLLEWAAALHAGDAPPAEWGAQLSEANEPG